MPDEHPCHRCGEWFPASELVPYTRGKGNEKQVTETFVYCPECDREIQNEMRDVMIEAGFDPDQNKERFE